jgi:hypothetical protein
MSTRILTGATMLALSLSASVLAQPVINVFDYGAAPRQELRYTYTVGEAKSATMNMGMEMTMSMGDVQMPGTTIPTIRVPMSIQTTEVRPDGSARYEVRMSDAELAAGGDGNPMLAQALAMSMREMADMSTWVWVDARGQTLDGGFDAQSGGNPQMAQVMGSFQNQLQQMAAPFPVEAIGVGARWELTTQLQMSGVDIMQTAEYTLLGLEGGVVELGIAMTQKMSAQPSAIPGAPMEALAALANLTSEGSGTMKVDLNYTMPYTEIAMSSSMSMGMPAQGQGQSPPMNMNIQMTIAIEPD